MHPVGKLPRRSVIAWPPPSPERIRSSFRAAQIWNGSPHSRRKEQIMGKIGVILAIRKFILIASYLLAGASFGESNASYVPSTLHMPPRTTDSEASPPTPPHDAEPNSRSTSSNRYPDIRPPPPATQSSWTQSPPIASIFKTYIYFLSFLKLLFSPRHYYVYLSHVLPSLFI
jgi:hypothetical protein